MDQQDISGSEKQITKTLNGAWKWTGTFRNGEYSPRVSLTYYFIFDNKKLYWIFGQKNRGVLRQDIAYEVQYPRNSKGTEVDAYPMANGMRLPRADRWLMTINQNRLYQARNPQADTYPDTFDTTGRGHDFSVAVFERTKVKIKISDRVRNAFVVKHKRTTNIAAEATLKRFIAALASHSFSAAEKLSVASTFEGFRAKQ